MGHRPAVACCVRWQVCKLTAAQEKPPACVVQSHDNLCNATHGIVRFRFTRAPPRMASLLTHHPLDSRLPDSNLPSRLHAPRGVVPQLQRLVLAGGGEDKREERDAMTRRFMFKPKDRAPEMRVAFLDNLLEALGFEAS